MATTASPKPARPSRARRPRAGRPDVSTRAGQPAAVQAARQAASASAPGTSLMNGVVPWNLGRRSADPMCTGHDDLGPGLQPGGLVGHQDVPVGRGRATDSRAEAPNRRRRHAVADRDLDDVQPPAADGTSRSSRPRAHGSAGGSVMPPTSRTSGIADQAEDDERRARVAGQPDATGTPPQSASSVGLPGRSAMPWPRSRRRPGRRRRRRSRRARRRTTRPRRPPRRCARPRRAARAASASRSSGTMPRRSGSPPASRTSAASAGAAASRTWPASSDGVGGSTTSSPVDTIATRGRAWTRDLGHARGRQQPEVLRAQRAPGGHEARRRAPRPRRDAPALARRHRSHDLDRAGHRLLRVLDHDDRVGALGHHARRSASPPRCPRRPRPRGARPIATAPMTSRYARQALGRAVRVGRPDGVAVDRRAGEAGQVVRGARPARRDAPARGRERRPSRSSSDAQAGSPRASRPPS